VPRILLIIINKILLGFNNVFRIARQKQKF